MPTKNTKSKHVQTLIEESLNILLLTGIPFEGKSTRALESMAMCLLAVAGVTKSWKEAKGLKDSRQLKTRDIITFINKNYEENISPGSYDDIRRKHLKLLVLSGYIINSGKNPSASTNDPTRGYSLEEEFKKLLRTYNTPAWPVKLKLFLKNKEPISKIIERKRDIKKIPLRLPDNTIIELSRGEHNELQREIIEEFLPRFAGKCELLYLGDTSNKILFLNERGLKELKFFKLSHEELPDIIAYYPEKNWLFLIEAVHSSGTMSEIRLIELKQKLKNCTADLIFVTAFISRLEFKKWILDIGWETEVWTADQPDHLIHFNGHKFLGPYSK